MHQIKWVGVVAFLCVNFVLASAGRADTNASTYSYFFGAEKSSYTVAPGGSLTVNLYLQEVNNVPANPSLLVSEDGLSGAGVDISFLSGSGLNVITAAAANVGTPATGFDGPLSTNFNASSATIVESTVLGDSVGVEGSAPVDGVSNVFLGTVTLQGSSLAGQTTVFQAAVVDPTLSNTYTNDSYYNLENNADPFNPAGSATLYNSIAATTFSLTTVVPEPVSLPLLGLAGLLLKRRGRTYLAAA